MLRPITLTVVLRHPLAEAGDVSAAEMEWYAKQVFECRPTELREGVALNLTLCGEAGQSSKPVELRSNAFSGDFFTDTLETSEGLCVPEASGDQPDRSRNLVGMIHLLGQQDGRMLMLLGSQRWLDGFLNYIAGAYGETVTGTAASAMGTLIAQVGVDVPSAFFARPEILEGKVLAISLNRFVPPA